MYEQTQENRLGKFLGAIFSLCYVVLWILLIVFVKFDNQVPEQIEQGIMIDFGDSEKAAGTTDLAHVVEQKQATPEPKVKAEPKVQTQQIEPAPEIVSEQVVEPVAEQVVKVREVNKKALFKGSTQQSPSKSEGESSGKGNQGHELGTVGGEKTGTGQSDSGQSFDLRGRNLIGELPLPAYQADELGRVIVRIVVSSRGVVTSATFEPVGSTVQNQTLVDAALSAAREAKFNSIDELTPQSGTITYTFRMQ